ncbi:MAG: heavy metal translocating P-type ATPase [Geminicoccaceae bacterium]
MAAASLKLRIEGMDCGACALKIENAMRGLPGASDISVSFGQAALSLTLDEDRTSPSSVEARIRALGFTPLSLDGPNASSSAAELEARSDRIWWTTRKARLVIAVGSLLLAAFLSAQLAPALAPWAYSVAALVGLVPIAARAWAGLRTGTPFGIETLMTIATLGALGIGEAAEAAIVVFLFAVGELLEGIAAGRAREGIKALIGLVPRTACRVAGAGIETVPVEALAVGDMVMVRPGDKVPSDGIVREGTSEVDEAPVTGESVPVAKEVGSPIFAGSINGLGELRVEITRQAADNTIARIVRMVEEAQSRKAPTARFIDRFSRWYTPAAMGVAALVMVGPPLLSGADWFTWIYRGLSLLLIACPCALVISTPAAIASGLASGARRGLLIKGGAALETMARLRRVAFDKTGTLTVGRPQVTDVVTIEGSESELLANAAAVERGSSHPLGVAIVAEAQARGLELPRVFGGSVAMPGKGVTARLGRGFVTVGALRHAAGADCLHARITGLEEAGKTVVAVSEGKRLAGLIALRDEPRADAAAGLARLRALGIDPVMLTGDNARTAASIASKLEIEVQAELLPDGKLAAIAGWRAQAPIAMVGDGINDAPGLAAASVGIAMGAGTDVALETADAALLNNHVTGVADLIALARATMANIRQNIAVALGLKGIFLVTSLTGATPLWMAILADTGATVLVTGNALRLLRFRPGI